MADKPATLCQLQKDKFLGGQVGFVDTFNWAVNAISNLKGGKNCSIDWTTPDRPVIDVDIPDTDDGGGGDGGGRVDDVSSETYQGGESLLVEYADGTADKHIPLSFVEDVSQATYQGGPALKIEYSSGANDKYIPLSSGGGGDGVQFTGTDGYSTTSLSNSFEFHSASDSNVVVTCRGANITIGVYYV